MKKLLLLLLTALLFTSCSREMVGGIEETFQKCQPRTEVQVWTNGIIPYYIMDNMPERNRRYIVDAAKWYTENTSVTFIQYEGDSGLDEFLTLPNKLLIKYSGTINSNAGGIGMMPIENTARFGVPEKFQMHDALHELGHTIGLPHEHQRADRDEYLIMYDETEKLPIDFVTEFDPNSIMIYPTSFVTMEMKDGREILPSKVPTALDKEKIDELYCYEINLKE